MKKQLVIAIALYWLSLAGLTFFLVLLIERAAGYLESHGGIKAQVEQLWNGKQ